MGLGDVEAESRIMMQDAEWDTSYSIPPLTAYQPKPR
jgi:hypothetical protein